MQKEIEPGIGSKALVTIFDGHNDAVQHLREYQAEGYDFLQERATGHLDLLRARAGGFAGGLFAMGVFPKQSPRESLRLTADGYEVTMAPPVAFAEAQREIGLQLRALRSMAARSDGAVRVETTVEGVEAARSAGALAMVLHLEGAEAIDTDLTELGALYEAGLRSVGPVWSRPNAFGHGVPFAYPRSPDTGPGLTKAGERMVRGCNELGVMIDLAHLNEAGFWDVARLSQAPLVASHTCAHGLCPSTRNLTDRQLDAIRATDGLVGMNFSVSDVRPDGAAEAETPLAMVVAQIRYLAERLGIERVGLGSDFDGATVPNAIGDARGLPRLVEALRASGFDEAEVRKIAWENWMRVLRLTIG